MTGFSLYRIFSLYMICSGNRDSRFSHVLFLIHLFPNTGRCGYEKSVFYCQYGNSIQEDTCCLESCWVYFNLHAIVKWNLWRTLGSHFWRAVSFCDCSAWVPDGLHTQKEGPGTTVSATGFLPLCCLRNRHCLSCCRSDHEMATDSKLGPHRRRCCCYIGPFAL